jgi:fucose 4-O-acetylase-like acetyltransferase
MKSDTRTKKRNELVDALKAFAIALVVLQHLLNLRPEFKFLPGAPQLVDAMFAFDMPLFTLLSGYVLVGREGPTPLRFLRGKVLALLVPYLAWIALVMPLRHLPPGDWLPRLGRALVNPHAGFQMWFLWVLFAMFVVFTLVRTLTRGSDVALGVSAVVLASALYLHLPDMFGLDKLCWLYPFLVAGYLVAKYRTRMRPADPWIAAAGIIGFPLLLWLGSPDPALRVATAAAGTAAAWGVYRLLPERLISWQAWAGAKTLGIYGAQMLVLPFVMVGGTWGWLGVAASEVTVMTAALLVTLVLERTAVTRAVFLGQWPRAWR